MKAFCANCTERFFDFESQSADGSGHLGTSGCVMHQQHNVQVRPGRLFPVLRARWPSTCPRCNGVASGEPPDEGLSSDAEWRLWGDVPPGATEVLRDACRDCFTEAAKRSFLFGWRWLLLLPPTGLFSLTNAAGPFVRSVTVSLLLGAIVGLFVYQRRKPWGFPCSIALRREVDADVFSFENAGFAKAFAELNAVLLVPDSLNRA